MKHLPYLFIFFVLCCSSSEGVEGLNGKVASMVENYLLATDTNGVIYDKVLKRAKKYTFNSDGYLITIEETDRQGELLSSGQVESYSNAGDAISIKTLDANGELLEQHRKIYEGSNLMSETFEGKINKKLSYTYENGKRVSGLWENRDGMKFRTFEYEWNSKGEMSKEVMSLPGGRLMQELTFKYEYDSKGNWIVKKTYRDGKLFDYIERIITVSYTHLTLPTICSV